MQLDRDEFLVTYDLSKAAEDDLTAIIQKAGYTSYVVSDEPPPSTAISDAGSLTDPAFAEAQARAQRENKPLVLDFHASWCVPCKRMDKETFADPRVAELLEQVVFLKIDTDAHPDLAKHFGVVGLPDIRFLRPDGTEVRQLLDFQDAELFAKDLTGLISPPKE